MLTRFFRWVLQVILVCLVGFFGFHYFTRPELHSCVSIPVSSLSGHTEKLDLDQDKVDEFMSRLTDQVTQVASRGGQLVDNLSSIETPAEAQGDIRSQLLDKGQYLYCKAVVEKVEKEQS